MYFGDEILADINRRQFEFERCADIGYLVSVCLDTLDRHVSRARADLGTTDAARAVDLSATLWFMRSAFLNDDERTITDLRQRLLDEGELDERTPVTERMLARLLQPCVEWSVPPESPGPPALLSAFMHSTVTGGATSVAQVFDFVVEHNRKFKSPKHWGVALMSDDAAGYSPHPEVSRPDPGLSGGASITNDAGHDAERKEAGLAFDEQLTEVVGALRACATDMMRPEASRHAQMVPRYPAILLATANLIEYRYYHGGDDTLRKGKHSDLAAYLAAAVALVCPQANKATQQQYVQRSKALVPGLFRGSNESEEA